MADFSREKKLTKTLKSILNMTSSDSQIDKPHKRAELPDVTINTGAQSINTESLFSLNSQEILQSAVLLNLDFARCCLI